MNKNTKTEQPNNLVAQNKNHPRISKLIKISMFLIIISLICFFFSSYPGCHPSYLGEESTPDLTVIDWIVIAIQWIIGLLALLGIIGLVTGIALKIYFAIKKTKNA